ncbi:NAD-dependent protein deacylase [Lachnospiraceae bacterium ASD3451]|nr:NAD-dependent protein deacylase [Diplocloster agilis]
MVDSIKILQEWIDSSDNIVFFGGAGVSTESGIPDFRSVDGLYHQEYDYPPETMLSRTFYERKPEEFYRFYRNKMLYLDAVPNEAHKKLAQLEQAGRLRAVITQNIDGLHQKAGSREVLELHGSVLRNYCSRCGRFYPVEAITESRGVPHCECGGKIKPDVVLYEEGLDQKILSKAVRYIEKADILIIGGTSLVVYPAAGLIDYYRGGKLVLINKAPTGMDYKADLLVQGSIGEIMSRIQVHGGR